MFLSDFPAWSEISTWSVVIGVVAGFLLGTLFSIILFLLSNSIMERWWKKKVSMQGMYAGASDLALLISRHLAPGLRAVYKPDGAEGKPAPQPQVQYPVQTGVIAPPQRIIPLPTEPPVVKPRRQQPKVAKPEPIAEVTGTPTPDAALEAMLEDRVAGQFKYRVYGAGPAFRTLDEALTVFPVEMRPKGATWDTLPEKIKSMMERVLVEPPVQ